MTKTAKFAAAALILISGFMLSNCKHDPAITRLPANDADSLYVGRAYVAPVIPTILYTYRPVISPSNNPMTYEGIQLGRMLFYDSTLSLNKHISCGSCHKQQYSFSDNQKLSQNVLGLTVRNTSTLINMGMNQKFFWDGRQSSIEDAVNDALNHEMHPDFTADISYLSKTPQYSYLFKKAFGRPGDVTEDKINRALSQFIRTLNSTNSRVDQYFRGEVQLTPAEAAGRDAFFDQNLGDCFHCHFDVRYLTFANQTLMLQNNGLDSESTLYGFKDEGFGAVSGNPRDNGKFKIPTLRNVAVSAPYMHDGRFATLDQVLDHYNEGLKNSPTVDIINLTHVMQGGLHLDSTGKANLLAFLNALTDTSFLHNPAYSNSFH
jgi:cytochrome c peroxidase